MWRPFKEYFNFTKKERRGIFYIVCIISILIIIPFFFPFFTKEERIDFAEFEKEIAQLKTDSSSKKLYSKKNDEEYYNDYTPTHKKGETSKAAELFYFDPNTATANDWIKLGIKQRTAETVQKYISKGGKFYKAEDIKKIWGLSEKDAQRLIPYVAIKTFENNFSYYEQNKITEKTFTKKGFIQKVDINIADTSQFISLPGVGSKLSKRIIAFREKLGGFYSIDQIAETYLLPDSTFQKIKPYLILQTKIVKKININASSVDEMKLHPYIKYQMANAIFQYRQQHGNFNSVEEIKKIMTVTDQFYNKVFPYLSAE